MKTRFELARAATLATAGIAGWLMAGLALAGTTGATAAPAPAASPPMQFQSERIRLAIVADSIEVDGLYRFVIRSGGTAPTRVFYPFPADERMGGARMLSLESRAPGGAWNALAWTDASSRVGVLWSPPAKEAGVVEVRAVYRQHLRSRFARYIVTTTAGWGAPLDSARFEIALPRGARALRFSYPFRETRRQGSRLYVFEARDFLPDRDVEFEWKP